MGYKPTLEKDLLFDTLNTFLDNYLKEKQCLLSG